MAQSSGELWHLRRSRGDRWEESGPYTQEELEELADNWRIEPEDQVRSQGSSGWRPSNGIEFLDVSFGVREVKGELARACALRRDIENSPIQLLWKYTAIGRVMADQLWAINTKADHIVVTIQQTHDFLIDANQKSNEYVPPSAVIKELSKEIESYNTLVGRLDQIRSGLDIKTEILLQVLAWLTFRANSSWPGGLINVEVTNLVERTAALDSAS